MNSDHAIIVAHDQALGIGKNNKLPWHIKGDLKFFQSTTCALPQGAEKQNAVIMGRKTWQSLPEAYRPLRGRINVVLTNNDSLFLPQGVLRNNDLKAALNRAAEIGCLKIFVIGGAAIYKQAFYMEVFRTLYITEVEGMYDCDTFLSDYRDQFELVESSSLNVEDNYRYWFKTYKRKK